MVLKLKVKKPFIFALGIVSFLSFIALALDSFGLIDISAWVVAFMFIVLGIGLIFEAGIRALLKSLRNRDSLPHLLTALIAILTIIVGILSIPPFMIEIVQFGAIKGVISIFAALVVALELRI